MTLRLRSVCADDIRLLWEWRNDPAIRAVSFDSDEIPWATHEEWFNRKLTADNCRIWVLECDGRAAGQVRYERQGTVAKASFSITAEFRGRGFGSEMLRQTVARACDALRVDVVIGSVLVDNTASRVTFERAGFQLVDGVGRTHDRHVTYRWAYRLSAHTLAGRI